MPYKYAFALRIPFHLYVDDATQASILHQATCNEPQINTWLDLQ
jgi:hypothetical protein